MSAHLDNRAVVCHRFSRTPASRRGGFTLAEILVAITVIAILAGLLTPVIIRSLQTAQEATITIEMQQMELAIQQFHSEHGFYPPTIGPGAEIDTTDPTGPQIMLRYLNRMAPNHQENNLAFGFGTGDTRLQDWWDEVGIHMDTRSSLVFWLNGLFKNKQFPLTGGATATAPLMAFDQDQYFDGTAAPAFERDLRFEFSQVVPDPGNPMVAFALQPEGDESEDLAYRYADYKSYSAGAYNDGTDFINPDTFQLIGFGIDGKSAPAGNVFAAAPEDDDNICNFAEGRLDKYVNENE